ncbi:MAG TPA: SigB/SigF/SigG family RNA polymerase sigma factor [Actinomycetota bacterium]|nr:SigB/SigF/SigG family RNA polymerase sigma factor [Actinomycetota bacterium]
MTENTRTSRSEEEIAELFARRPAADARDELAREFLPLAEYFARRFAGRGEPVEDLTQTASLGLLNAIDRFDAERGVPFSTYAAATIVGELKRHFRDRGWALRVPRNVQETAILVNRTVSSLWQEKGRAPTVQEIASTADIGEDDVLMALDALQAYTTDSLDAPIGDATSTAAEAIGAEDRSYEVSEEWLSLAPALRDLPERERTILYLRFFEGLTQTEIAEQLGISQMHVSRLVSQSLEKLRRKSGEG